MGVAAFSTHETSDAFVLLARRWLLFDYWVRSGNEQRVFYLRT